MSARHRNASDGLHGRIAHWLFHPKRIPALSLIQQSESVSVVTGNSESTRRTTHSRPIDASEPSVENRVVVLDSVLDVVDVQRLPIWARVISPRHDLHIADALYVVHLTRCTSAIRSWIQQATVPTPFTSTDKDPHG